MIRLVVSWAALLAALLPARGALAYPQFQLSADGAQRCNQCHFSPSGGTLINGYGRSQTGDTLAAGGNGGLLHGKLTLPEWLALGGDLRGAFVASDVGETEGPQVALFPMQGDVYLHAGGGGVSFNATVGLRGSARGDRASYPERTTSREHYLLWQSGNGEGAYVRAGRFLLPYGLRLVEHVTYVRRFLGQNLLEEPYAFSGGYIKNDWELHVSAFTPFPIAPVGQRGSGGVVYYENRLSDSAILGGQARVSIAGEQRTFQGGLVGKYFLEKPKLLTMGELDVVRQQFPKVPGGAGRNQLVSYLGVFWMPLGGYFGGLAWERYDEDLAVRDVARDSFSVQAHWWPVAHLELLLYGRAQFNGGGDAGDPAKMVMLQIHYWL